MNLEKTKEMRKSKRGELKKMKTNLWDGLKFNVHPIRESFFYRSLVGGDRKLYDDYRELTNSTCGWVKRRSHRRVSSYEEFVELFNDIRDNGWDVKSYIQLGKRRRGESDLIQDGQHRASILLFLDENIKVNIRRRKATLEEGASSIIKIKVQ